MMQIRRVMTATCLSLLALLTLAMPAGAGVSWCRSDPIVELNGTEVQVWVAIDEAHVELVTGPIEVTVFTPNKVSKEVTFLDPGFNGYGEAVRFKHRGKVNDDGTFPVEIRVRVPVDMKQLRNTYGQHDIPVMVEVITGAGISADAVTSEEQRILVVGNNHGTFVSLNVRGTY